MQSSLPVRLRRGFVRPHLQNSQRKMDWGRGSSDSLFCKYEALSSNPSPPAPPKNKSKPHKRERQEIQEKENQHKRKKISK
jgi:hypothetical protein